MAIARQIVDSIWQTVCHLPMCNLQYLPNGTTHLSYDSQLNTAVLMIDVCQMLGRLFFKSGVELFLPELYYLY